MPNEPEASVSVGEWTWTDDEARYISQDPDTFAGVAIWTDYFIKNRYEIDGHVYMLGSASPTGFGISRDTVSFIQLCSKTILWVADWTCAKLGEPPRIPNPDYVPNGWVLLDMHYEKGMITVPPDGRTPYYRMSGTYYYGHRQPSQDVIMMMAWPRPPWLEDFVARTVSSTQIFERDLINPVMQTGGSGPGLDNPVILPR